MAPAFGEAVLREAWPTVVGATARLTRDLDLAEDCTQDAVERALRAGVAPENPVAWLTTTARRIALDHVRREATLRRKLPLLVVDGSPDPVPEATDPLRLLFACCHPALARESQVALTLRLVCGIEVATLASLLLTGRAGVARRLTRAKQKIAAAGIPFRVPSDDELPGRLDTVLTVVHLLHTAGHDRTGGPGGDLTAHAEALTRMLVRLLPDEPEPRALHALILLERARHPSRTGADGRIVLLPDQDRTRWDRATIRAGLRLATEALTQGPHGRFALQAGIAGLHTTAPSWAETDWGAIATTYDALMAVWPSPVVALNRVAVRSRLPDADLAALLDELDLLDLPGYRHLSATRADLLTRLGRPADAAAAYDAALALSTDPAERALLTRRRREVAGEGVTP